VLEISSSTKVDVSDRILSELQARYNLEGMFALEVEGRIYRKFQQIARARGALWQLELAAWYW
jgi:hypothetical protein